jgi:tetratricopeptide (TPR) repeat protein
MDAVISGRAGTALLIDGNSLFSFDVDDVNAIVPRQQSDLPFLLGDGVDLQFFENVEPDQVKQQLELAYDSACALDLTLILLDSELSDEVRKEAVEELEALFADTQIIERLENLLYARPLPDAADIIGALDRSEETGAKIVTVVTHNLLERQPFIREVFLAWNAIPSDIFGGVEQKAEFQRVAVSEGLFRALVIAYLDEKVNEFLLDALGRPSIRALRSYISILQQWASGFRSRTAPPEIQEPEEEFETELPQRKGRKPQHQSRDRVKVLGNVEKRKQIIIEHMRRRDFDRLQGLVDELVEYQQANGGAKFTVKSLCDLATEAKLMSNHRLQLELTERSINLEHDDAWSWAQYADALLNMGRPAEALEAYEQADAFGAGVVAKTGRAETLRALGRLNDALDAYDYAIAQHPEDTIAKNGRSCVLMALRRYEEALADLPNEELCTLQDWMGYHIRGMILLRMGQVDEALNVFEQGMIGNPWHSEREIFRTALGIAWMRKQNFPKASKVLEEVSTPALQAQADILRIHAYGEEGKIELAKAAYDRVAANPQFQSDELMNELHRKYILGESAQHDDEWVFDREVNMLLAATSQNLFSSSFVY